MGNFLMIDCTQCLTNPNGWITLIIGSFISALIPFLMYTMKPKLKIHPPAFAEDMNSLKFKIENTRAFSYAINLKIEVALIEKREEDKFTTYHFELDREEFLILPSKDKRCFQTNEITKSTLEVLKRKNPDFANKNCKDAYNILVCKMKENSDIYIRIRIYAQHEYSGFGKAFEGRFNKNQINEQLKNILNNTKVN
ncbi:MAG: hypothetical protein WCH34_17875 [Bacteroidota bacterium]